MEMAISLANNFLVLLDAMSIYILIGLLIAGILKQLIPDDFVVKHLGKGSVSSVLKATIFGIPLPSDKERLYFAPVLCPGLNRVSVHPYCKIHL